MRCVVDGAAEAGGRVLISPGGDLMAVIQGHDAPAQLLL
jgi:hypothetical protein